MFWKLLFRVVYLAANPSLAVVQPGVTDYTSYGPK